jgi:UDP-glucose 4-epimerase
MSTAWESAYRGERVLVTGGLGFIGSHVARRLVELGARVTVVDALIPDHGGNYWNIHDVADQIEVHEVNLNDDARLAPLVRDQAWIFNLAGQVSHIDSMTHPLTDLDINCRAHLTLLEVCRRNARGARILYAGTRQQYGRPQYLPVDENHPLRPTDVNGINKLAGEAYHRLYHDVYGLETASLRMTNTFGPGMLLRHPRQGFLAVFIRRALEGETIQVFGDGRQQRDYTYVDDAVRAFLMLGVQPSLGGEIYNLGSPEVYSVRQIAEMLVAIVGRGRVELVPFPDERKAIDIGSYHGSFAKLRAAVGWEPQVPVRTGLERTLAYYRAHGEHYL